MSGHRGRTVRNLAGMELGHETEHARSLNTMAQIALATVRRSSFVINITAQVSVETFKVELIRLEHLIILKIKVNYPYSN